MNHSVQHKIKRPNNKIAPVLKSKKTNSFSRVIHSTKRYSKLTLKNILLSKVFYLAFKIIVSILFVAAVLYGGYKYFHASFLNDVVVSKSEIVGRVSKLTILPNEEPQEVVRVEDAEILKKQNSFYENAKAGDYIIMYQKIAIIYDLRNNTIVAIKKSE